MNRFILKGLSLSVLSMIFCGPVLAAPQILVHDRFATGSGVQELLVTVQKTDAKGGASAGNVILVKVAGNTYLKMPETSKVRSLVGYQISDLVIAKDRGKLTEINCDVSGLKNIYLNDQISLSLSIDREPSEKEYGIKSCKVTKYE